MQSLLLSQVIEDKLRMATAIMVRTTEKEDLLLSIHASQTPQSVEGRPLKKCEVFV